MTAFDPDYPRDLVGHGETPPHARWPGGARIALQFVLNYEEGAENSVLHGDEASETFLSEIVGAQAFRARHMSMETLYEYGSRAGVWRVLRLFREREVPLTIFGVAMALLRHPSAVDAFLRDGHEIASHGWRWISYQNVDESTEREHVARAVEAIHQLTGSAPDGWYTGRDSPNTRRLVVEHGGFVYDADSYADDLPHWVEVKTSRGLTPHLVVPYALDTNDMRFASPQGFNSGEQFFDYLKDAFDTLYAEGDPAGLDAPKMLSIGLHCRIVGRPARLGCLARFVDYARSHDRVWFARRIDIARHWIATHPFVRPASAAGSRQRARPPSRERREAPERGRYPTLAELNALDRAGFTAALGGVFEHSPWVAERAYGARPFARVEALHDAMLRVAHSATRDEQLALIRAHPELAGRAMVRDEMTADSVREQSGAGLMSCSPDEYRRLVELNARYRAKFGFPFILAVKGYDRAGVIAEFARRVERDAETEFAEALTQIARITKFRLEAMID